jgi:hypothetical protein
MRALVFRDVTLQQWVSGSQRIKGISGTIHPPIHCHIPEDQNPLLHCCENLKTCRKIHTTNQDATPETPLRLSLMTFASIIFITTKLPS